MKAAILGAVRNCFLGGIRWCVYLWVDVHMDGAEFVRQLLRIGVVATPGEVFGKSGKNYVRFSATQSTDKIVKATKKIEEITLEKIQKTIDH